jgi:hypothetical protein
MPGLQGTGYKRELGPECDGEGRPSGSIRLFGERQAASAAPGGAQAHCAALLVASTPGYCGLLLPAGAIWTPRRPARSTVCCTNPELLASSMNSLT